MGREGRHFKVRPHQVFQTARFVLVEPGDRIALQAEKSPEVIMIYLGVLMAGAVFVPVNPLLKAAGVSPK